MGFLNSFIPKNNLTPLSHTLKISYTFQSRVWKHDSSAGWFFVSLPKKISKEIRTHLQWQEEGWGRLKATASIGETEWNTAIWYVTKQKTYLLPLKAACRKKEKIEVGKNIVVQVKL